VTLSLSGRIHVKNNYIHLISFGNKVVREYFSLFFRFSRKNSAEGLREDGKSVLDVVSKIGVGVVRMDSTNASQDLVFGVFNGLSVPRCWWKPSGKLLSNPAT
jgi:hypothetical protein